MRAAFDESIKVKCQYEQLIVALMSQDAETRAKVQRAMQNIASNPSTPTPPSHDLTENCTDRAAERVPLKARAKNGDNRMIEVPKRANVKKMVSEQNLRGSVT